MLNSVREIIEAGLLGYAAASPVDAIQAVVVLFALGSVWPVARRFGLAYGLFMLVNLAPPLLTGGMTSAGRYTSTLFPMFLWLGAVVPPGVRTPWVAACATVQGLVAAAFFTWRALA
ncbi:MAG: hypothetical protein ACE148_09345 [Vicinamibacterales bacterium]